MLHRAPVHRQLFVAGDEMWMTTATGVQPPAAEA
jgi:hypothetical protein